MRPPARNGTPPPDPTLPDPALKQRKLRLRRFGMALSTYLLGFGILSACTLLGLLPGAALAAIGGWFVFINIALAVAFFSGWNQRWADPSLTLLQTGLGVTSVALILVLGRDTAFTAAPFYSVLFVFAMLQLRPRQVAGLTGYLFVSYGIALALRQHRFGDSLDLRVEAVTAVLVVGSSLWFAFAAGYISNLRARLRDSRQQIQVLATRDGLTGLWNRRHIDVLLESAVQFASRHGTPLCVALVDVDHFQRVNDRHGHATGDRVLEAVANALVGSLRSEDHVGRYGGEEFVLLLSATSLNQAATLTERLRQHLNTRPILPAGEGPVTASFGLAEWRSGETAGALVQRADRALYRAKAAGRNRVEADGAPAGPVPQRDTAVA
jgi:diguanylate cyclase